MKLSQFSSPTSLTTGLVILFAVSTLLLTSPGCIISSPFQHVVREEDFGAWKYRATTEEDGWTMVQVLYDDRSLDEVQAFIAANKKMGQELSSYREQPFHGLITFRRPLSIEEFQRLIADSGVATSRIKSYGFQARSTTSKWWFGGAPQGETLIDEGAINRVLDTRRSKVGSADLLGIVYVETSLTPSEYQHVISDSRVALIDVTREIVKERLKNTPGVNMNKVSFAVGSPYGAIEKFELVEKGKNDDS
jgi:hypothetical protein